MNENENAPEQVWIELARAYRHVLEQIEQALKSHDLPALEWYDVLLEVERAGPDGIRPYALQKKLLLPQYGMSRILDRIEKQSLIAKKKCEEDGRGFVVCITSKGAATRRQMWPVYEDVLSAGLGRKLSEDQMRDLKALLSLTTLR